MSNRSKLSVSVIALATIGVLSGCGGVTELTRDRVARSEQSVIQAQQSLGNSEAGAVELQRAKDEAAQARRALEAKQETRAQRYAEQAQLDADLALAKAQTASSRKAADELLASIQTLRQESNRATSNAVSGQ